MPSQPRDLIEAPVAKQALAAAAPPGAADCGVSPSAPGPPGASSALRLLIDSVKDYALITLDPSGRIATWNAGAELIKGYKADEIIGSHFSRFYPEEDVRAGKCERELALAKRDGRFEDEGWRVCKDGSRFWANVVISAIRDDAGKLVGFSKVTRDLTERRRSEEERAARLAAEQANQTKDEFLAMLGHELRNPLAPIVSALQLLKLRDDGKFAREHQIIERQVKQMTRLVEDLLDVSRISRGKIELKHELVDLRESLAKAVELALPLLERKGHHFEVRVPEGALVVSGDDARLIQVFANLLNNAAKYTDDGGQILLAVEAGAHELEIEIRDNGTGIEPALLPRVFELFVQGYQDADRAGGGLGVGLTLVKSLVSLHGGSVEARSGGEERGSRFFVRLPRAEPPAGAEPKRVARSPAALRRKILVVDDNEDARVLLAELLTKSGHEVETAEDGLTALQVLEGFQPDVAILDIGLPGMDGCELARRIRQLPAQATVRLLALTGYGQEVDRLNTRAAGFDVHLVKPLDLQGLLGHLR